MTLANNFKFLFNPVRGVHEEHQTEVCIEISFFLHPKLARLIERRLLYDTLTEKKNEMPGSAWSY